MGPPEYTRFTVKLFNVHVLRLTQTAGSILLRSRQHTRGRIYTANDAPVSPDVTEAPGVGPNENVHDSLSQPMPTQATCKQHQQANVRMVVSRLGSIHGFVLDDKSYRKDGLLLQFRAHATLRLSAGGSLSPNRWSNQALFVSN